jgi:alkylation response protein AidB-like acyl-CoA dehydrogenase
VDFGFTPEQEALKQEITQWCEEVMTPERIANIESQGELMNAHDPELYAEMGKKGWLGLQWPKEYGGAGYGHLEMGIFNEVVGYYRVPMAGYGLTVNIVGNSIITYGSEKLKKEFLPRIASGEILFCQGFSEPNSGSDLASLQTRAVQDGDEYVINGQKIFTTNAHFSDYVFLATRTDPDVPKHKGLSIFLVNMKTPGITVRPLYTLGGGRVNETFFEDVRIPADQMLGEKNRGWYHMTTTLDFERSGLTLIGGCRRAFEDIVQYAKETSVNGKPLAKDPVIRQKLAQLETELCMARLLSYRVASMQHKGLIPNHEASMCKAYGGELSQRVAHIGLQIMGLYGQLQMGSKYAPLHGRIEAMFRQSVASTIAGGTNEVQRLIIAGRGLGLPR